MNFCSIGNIAEVDTLRILTTESTTGTASPTSTTIATTTTTTKLLSPKKSEITLNALQDEQNSLIEQRIQDRTTNLRADPSGGNSTWPIGYHNNRVFTNLDINNGAPGAPRMPCIFTTNTITSCMVTTNRNLQWFSDRSNLSIKTTSSWQTEFPQGIAKHLANFSLKNFSIHSSNSNET